MVSFQILSFYTLITSISSNKIVLSNFRTKKNLIWLAYMERLEFGGQDISVIEDTGTHT